MSPVHGSDCVDIGPPGGGLAAYESPETPRDSRR